MKQKEIERKFANEKNMYYAHGIGAYNEDVINSIFKNGLRCSHNELYWTVEKLGKGSESLFRNEEENMSNWKHKGSKHIIIASLPEKFQILDTLGAPSFQKRHAAFYNSISQEKAKEIGVAPGLYLKPEFVMGMYDTIKKDFISNDKYYENLPLEKQKIVLDEVKNQYIDIIKNSNWTLKEYAQILQDIGIECPLTLEEIENSDNEKINTKSKYETKEIERKTENISIRKQFEEMKEKEEERKTKNTEEKVTFRKQFEKIENQKENPKKTETGDDSRGKKKERETEHISIHEQEKEINKEKKNNIYSQFKKMEVKESILRSKITKSETEKTMRKIRETRERKNRENNNEHGRER